MDPPMKDTHLFKSRISHIDFSLFSPEEIRRMSVCLVEHPESVENGIIKENGLLDLRMGTSERGYLCLTCGEGNAECVGHFGHIELSKPVFHVGFVQKIKKVLESVCFFCSKIKINKKNFIMQKVRGARESKLRLNRVWSLAKSKMVCPEDGGCGNKQPLIKKEGLNLVALMKDDEGKVMLTGEKVHSILKKINEEDMEQLGFCKERSRPDWMILTVLLVPPPPVRPSVVMEGVLRGEDDLTHKLSDIVKANNNLRRYEQEGAPAHVIKDYEQLLQFHVATLMDNEVSGQPQALQKSGRPLKSISARLKGKEGRVRGNLMGKRVDFSARSVITPDSNISLAEVGVPKQIAMIHTFPEKVNSLNIEKIEALIKNGPFEHPGANYLVREDGQRIDLRYNRSPVIKEGYIVERHMVDGDIVLFNRQPSLHKMSMMAHKVRILDKSTFRLNLSATTPYNADFDGDEMNLHMPQSYQTMVELKELAYLPTQIVSPQGNKPVMGLVQDTLIGCRLISCKNQFFSKSEVMTLLFHSGKQFSKKIIPAIKRPLLLTTGKQIFSLAFPDVNFDLTEEKKISLGKFSLKEKFEFLSSEISEDEVLVHRGYFLKGRLSKKTMGNTQGGLIHVINNDFGPERVTDFFNTAQRIINSFLTYFSSFSCGIGDTIADGFTMKQIIESIEQAKIEVRGVISDLRIGKMKREAGHTVKSTFESKVLLALNRARDVSGKSAQGSLAESNNVKHMVLAGSKGSFINISQVSACVGQQIVEGKRIPYGFKGRTLPHFSKFDYGPESRGFVENSFLSGLTPAELFFHTMGGREGLIDTAIKTAETGYIQRRLVKSMEDCKISYDYSVRDGSGRVFQYLYGKDGYDATFLEHNFINGKRLTLPLNFRRVFLNEKKRALKNSTSQSKPNQTELKNLKESSETLKEFEENENLKDSNDLENLRNGTGSINKKIENLKNNLIEYVKSKNFISSKIFVEIPSIIPAIEFFVSPKFLKGMTENSLKILYSEIKSRLDYGMIAPNSMVGTLASQSIGEPATQMTLNTFHYAGVASTVTMGVPRLKEIINVAKNIKTPMMTLYLPDETKFIESEARRIQATIAHLRVNDIVSEVQVIYDPVLEKSVIPEDNDLVEAYYEFPDEEIPEFLCKWVIRLILKREALISFSLETEEVVNKIRGAYGKDVQVISSDSNATLQVIRVRVALECDEEFYQRLAKSILEVEIFGYKGISRTFLNDSQGEFYIQAEGMDFLKILSHPELDGSRCTTNFTSDIYDVLGVEAARTSLFTELRKVIEADGSYVNFRHLELLVDVMCARGKLDGITRHGFNKYNSVLMRCTFEETVDILLEAALTSDTSNCKSVTECIMTGMSAPIGSGATEIILDLNALKDAKPIAQFEFEFEQDFQGAELLSPESTKSPENCGKFSPIYSPGPTGLYSPNSPSLHPYSPRSPTLSPTTPTYTSTTPMYNPSTIPRSPIYSPQSFSTYAPVSPGYAPTSPKYVATSPKYSPTTPKYSPSSTFIAPTTPPPYQNKEKYKRRKKKEESDTESE